MIPLADQIEALLDLNAKGAVSHPVPGLAVELLTKAAQSLRAQGGVRIKPLEWQEFWNRSEAKSTVGDYIIMPRRDGAFDWRLDGVVSCWASSSDTAKAAAQADYERRILSSLEASPAPVSEEMARRFIKRYREIWPGAGWPSLSDATDLLTAALAAKGGQ